MNKLGQSASNPFAGRDANTTQRRVGHVITWLPSATDKHLGINKWGAGPAAVALTIQGPWVFGVLAGNVWAGTTNRRGNTLTIQPFVNYNLPHGWYLTSSPVVTSNWLADSGDRWTVPIGGGVGRLFKIDLLPITAQVQGFCNVARPANAPSWTLRFQVQALFTARTLERPQNARTSCKAKL
jgi:hypothetical protein